jgi:hypothetical protein
MSCLRSRAEAAVNLRRAEIAKSTDEDEAKKILASFGISVELVHAKEITGIATRTSWAAPYDPHIWDSTRELRLRMFGFGLEFACGPLAIGDIELAEAAFMRSRNGINFRKACIASESSALSHLRVNWANDIFTTAAMLMNGHRHFVERGLQRRARVFPSYKVWGPPVCTDSPHGAIHGFIAPIDDPIWDRIIPPFDYACGCEILGEESASSVGDPGKVPDCALTSHDWMPVFPSHLKLKRFEPSNL